MITNDNTGAAQRSGPNQEAVNHMMAIAPGTAAEWLRQLCRHYGLASELAQYRNIRTGTFADMGYDHAARSATLYMSEVVLYSKTVQMNKLACSHGLPPVLEDVNKVKSEAVARILNYAEGLIAQSPYAKNMGGALRVKREVISKLIMLEPESLAKWTKQVCRLYALVAQVEQYWILRTHVPLPSRDLEHDFEGRSRRLQAEADAVCRDIRGINKLAYAHSFPAVLPRAGDWFETTALLLDYVESLVAQSGYSRFMCAENPAA